MRPFRYISSIKLDQRRASTNHYCISKQQLVVNGLTIIATMEVIESETWKRYVVDIDSGCVRTDTRRTANQRKYRHIRVQDME